LIGFIFSSVYWLMDVGIFLFVGAVAFSLITLPVEFNASTRAIAVLQGMGYLQGEEVNKAKAVLNAAAWTYVAAATMALSHLIRLLILRSSRD
jgi:Zn-dependent membrane protease YugP